LKLTVQSPVHRVPGVGTVYRGILQERGIHTVRDLLLHFPSRYIDLSRFCPAPRAGPPEGLYRLKIRDWSLSRLYHRRLSILKIRCSMKEREAWVIFFNRPYLIQQLARSQPLFIHGIFQYRNQRWETVNPRIIRPEDLDGIMPIYRPIGKLRSGKLKSLIQGAIDSLTGGFGKIIPRIILEKYGIGAPDSLFYALHRPSNQNPVTVDKAREVFVYLDFFLYHLKLYSFRHRHKSRPRRYPLKMTVKTRDAIAQRLPFTLSDEQLASFEEIVRDLTGPRCMQRLLMGDVGCGKTILSFLALLMAVTNGYQGAFLAPTEVLAHQHYLNAQRFFRGMRVELLTGSTPAGNRRILLQRLGKGEIDILFGTHALLHRRIRFSSLSMVVIDEQHRFGVSQRTRMYCKNQGTDLLVTTATPIPRTLRLSLYRDLSVSLLKEKPFHSPPVMTRKIPDPDRDRFYNTLASRLSSRPGKAYIVVPLIRDSDSFTELRSIATEKPYYREKFSKIPLGFLTGQDTAARKQKAIENLREGKIRILISTTVIEVGLDVRDMTHVVIENADRYGLAQLHQLRGRVGRGGENSFCYLLASANPSENGQRRLEVIQHTDNGFEVAEQDLRMRGGGILFGYEQSGFPDFRVGDPRRDPELFRQARLDIQKWWSRPGFQQDPQVRNYLEEWNREWQDIGIN